MLAIRTKILKKILENNDVVEEMNQAKTWKDVYAIIKREARKIQQ